LSSRLLSKGPANGGPKFCDPAANLSSRAAKRFGNSSPVSTRRARRRHCSWPSKPSTPGLSRARRRCRKNSGAVAADARKRRHRTTTPSLWDSQPRKRVSSERDRLGDPRTIARSKARPGNARRRLDFQANARKIRVPALGHRQWPFGRYFHLRGCRHRHGAAAMWSRIS
jgi:hypothetical protein